MNFFSSYNTSVGQRRIYIYIFWTLKQSRFESGRNGNAKLWNDSSGAYPLPNRYGVTFCLFTFDYTIRHTFTLVSWMCCAHCALSTIVGRNNIYITLKPDYNTRSKRPRNEAVSIVNESQIFTIVIPSTEIKKIQIQEILKSKIQEFNNLTFKKLN